MSPDRQDPPSDVLGPLLKHATQQFTALVDWALQPFGVDSKDLGVLRALATHEPTSQLQLAHGLGIDRTTMVAQLDVLEGKGILTRRADLTDRRRNVVELTEYGYRTYDSAEGAYNEAEVDFLEDVDAPSVARLRSTLKTLVD